MFPSAFGFRVVARTMATVAAGIFLLSTGHAVARDHLRSQQEKLEQTVLPDVEFHQTSLSDVLEFLRAEAARLSYEPNPAERGVNLILNAPVVAAANPKITLSLRQIPLKEVLKYVASQAGLKVKTEAYAVSLVPLTENTEPLVTAEFRVPPGFFGNRPAGATRANPLDQPATSVQ